MAQCQLRQFGPRAEPRPVHFVLDGFYLLRDRTRVRRVGTRRAQVGLAAGYLKPVVFTQGHDLPAVPARAVVGVHRAAVRRGPRAVPATRADHPEPGHGGLLTMPVDPALHAGRVHTAEQLHLRLGAVRVAPRGEQTSVTGHGYTFLSCPGLLPAAGPPRPAHWPAAPRAQPSPRHHRGPRTGTGG